MKLIRIILLILTLTTLGSCKSYYFKPMGRIFDKIPQDGSPAFNLGWRHGCESGLATGFGGTIYKHFYKWKKDENMLDNPEYNRVFWRAHIVCRHMVLGTLKLADMAPRLPGEQATSLGEHNIGSVYNLRPKYGDMRPIGNW